ncbi:MULTISPECIES: dihydrodipicolinate synthase family protein [Yersiniaceae]|uniref:Dihydrodipicolinate synthase family protein n=1 Tax=Rahnella perminowiae TaxID=2816244 RepID=A0ABS6KUZ3_9GAMM|nr:MULTISPECIES: dihydrodipicolinate synthase family protein [Yersiniaceae]MBU9809775.1 dihydrodipicolinate synthase family protein [Rahnella perminowiae]MBU9824584.1 dihydrodipicolinate synthase family protein [Rahnella perminowiae]MBU9833291.1 dihydrodipicolinate synthase family protein [Rahnella perminowiae]MBU9864092.1 dihydrodipicolinate synthase family protein [Rahnella aceris]MCC3704415.1 dihydrodipicolinate synthase family protein [Rouxiella badensis]
MFTGLSAFPLTPVTNAGFDEPGFVRILERITSAGADSIGVLGSTGSYAYLRRPQRSRIAAIAKSHAGNIPVIVCVGSVSTDEVLRLADDAQTVGADALLLPPVSYQTLREDEVFGLFETLMQHVSVPVCIYDNPGTTRFEFSDELHGRIARLPGIRSVKIPGVPSSPVDARVRVQRLKSRLPEGVTIGISGDASAATGLNAGCEVWYSVCGGLFPLTAKEITDAAARGEHERVVQLSERLQPLWGLFRKHGGSIRVMAAAAGVLGLTETDCLPRPLRPLSASDIAEIATVVSELNLK